MKGVYKEDCKEFDRFEIRDEFVRRIAGVKLRGEL